MQPCLKLFSVRLTVCFQYVFSGEAIEKTCTMKPLYQFDTLKGFAAAAVIGLVLPEAYGSKCWQRLSEVW